jgi:hypothetical protein
MDPMSLLKRNYRIQWRHFASSVSSGVDPCSKAFLPCRMEWPEDEDALGTGKPLPRNHSSRMGSVRFFLLVLGVDAVGLVLGRQVTS